MEKKLNEAEILSVQRLRQKGLTYAAIAERIGISVEQAKSIIERGFFSFRPKLFKKPQP